MYNVLLDKLPDNYKGYLIRTDFRIGMQIYACMKDDTLTEQEKYGICLNMLYGKGIPDDISVAIDGLKWFLTLGEKTKQEEQRPNSKEIMDFEIDSSRIYSGFMSTLNIDLNTTKMHWFKFRYLLLELNKCHLSNVIDIRMKDTKGMQPKQKAEINKLKRMYSIDDSYQKEQEQQLMNFFK